MKNFNYPGQAVNPSLNRARASQPAATKTVPFDYVFQFALQGQRGNKVQDVVEISMEGVFVALSVGYSLVPDEKKTPQTFTPVVSKPGTLPAPALLPFFNLQDQNLTGVFVVGTPGADIDLLLLKSPPAQVFINAPNAGTATALSPFPQILGSAKISQSGIATIITPVVGSGSILCLRDKSNDTLSQPVEVGNPATATLGPDFRILNQPDAVKTSPAVGDSSLFVYGFPGTSVRVALLEKTTGLSFSVKNRAPNSQFDSFLIDSGNIPGAIVNPPPGVAAAAQVPLSVDDPVSGARVDKTLSSGDLLLVTATTPVVGVTTIPFSAFVVPPRRTVADITLGELEAGLEKNGSDLTRGFRLNANGGGLRAVDLPLDRLSDSTSSGLFATISAAAEEVSFLYSIDIGGTGREYQNKAIHNIAGLGVANGDRPFRPFAKPILFEPRSFIRIQVEELSRIPGTLYVVLQGYKMLGTSQAPM